MQSLLDEECHQLAFVIDPWQGRLDFCGYLAHVHQKQGGVDFKDGLDGAKVKYFSR